MKVILFFLIVAINGTSIYLLLEELKPSPLAEASAMCTSGCDMAAGELNEDCLFPALIFPDTPEARLYLYSQDSNVCFERSYDGYQTTRDWSPTSIEEELPARLAANAPEIDYL